MLPDEENDTLEPSESGRRRALISGPEGVTAAEIEAAVDRIKTRNAEGLVWIDILKPTEADGAFLRDVLGFHPLAVEDCLYGKQNPKLERYPGYFFLVLYA